MMAGVSSPAKEDASSPTHRPLRIALCHTDLPNESKGGVAHQSHQLGNILTQRGHDVTMMTFSPAFDECEYRVQTLPAMRGPKYIQSYAFAFALAQVDFRDFDVIHCMGDNYLMGSRNRPPLLRTMHGSARDEMRTASSYRRVIQQATMVPLETLGAMRADYVTGVSETTKARIPQVKEIIPNGVDLRLYRPARPEDKAPVPTLLFVGTRQGRKRGQWLGDLWTNIIRPRLGDAARLWAVSDEPITGEGIVNHGRVSQEKLIDLYKQAWVFCLPSTYEGFGVPYIEAFASGTAVVASPNSGANEVLGNGHYGVLAADDRLADQIIALLTDGNTRAEWASIGIKRAQDFDWQSVAARYETVYQRMIAAAK